MTNTPKAPEIDPITLEVMRNGLQSIAEEMGSVLKNTSFSPNIKERMDASCAIFDVQGELVAQAEHVPVHLGSMLVAVRQILNSTTPLETLSSEGRTFQTLLWWAGFSTKVC